jgi:hypothetical protein
MRWIITGWISLDNGHPHGWEGKEKADQIRLGSQVSSQAPTAVTRRTVAGVSPPHAIAAEDGKRGAEIRGAKVHRMKVQDHSLIAEASEDDK